MTTHRGLLASCTFITLLLVSFLLSPLGISAAGGGTISVEQKNNQNVFGAWSIAKPDQSRIEMTRESATLEGMPVGNYTLIARPPEGAQTTTKVFVNDELTTEIGLPQVRFTIAEGDTIRIILTYVFTEIGTVSVDSTPLGLSFVLKGPNNTEYEGTTPKEYSGVAHGLYSAYFEQIEGCAEVKPISKRLQAGSRIQLSISIICDKIKDTDLGREGEKTLVYVTVHMEDGSTLVLDDVPLGRWYSEFIHRAVTTGIMSGYRDAQGEPLGKFGPNDLVTIAQLAKIAHELAGIDENEFRTPPQNKRALGTWFERYVSSAEGRDWHLFRDRGIDPDRPATRAEVIATLIQALDVPRLWPKGLMFKDVSTRLPYADSIETAATNGIVSGYVNEDGTATGNFGPNNSVNRAEMAKIASLAMDIFIEKLPQILPDNFEGQ